MNIYDRRQWMCCYCGVYLLYCYNNRWHPPLVDWILEVLLLALPPLDLQRLPPVPGLYHVPVKCPSCWNSLHMYQKKEDKKYLKYCFWVFSIVVDWTVVVMVCMSLPHPNKGEARAGLTQTSVSLSAPEWENNNNNCFQQQPAGTNYH